MKKKEKKKRKLKWKIKLILIIILLAIYSIFIGTKGLFIKEFKIESNKIDDKTSGIKIVHFSDLLYGSTTNNSEVINLIKKINITKPDIVIFTGNLIYTKYKLEDKEKENLIKSFSSINAELGKYYVPSKNDDEDSKEILNSSGFININKEEQIIYSSINNPILLIGKDNSKMFFSQNQDKNLFKILCINNPSDLDSLIKYDFDIALAGNTLNGLINIPKVKDLLIKSKYKNTYQKVNNTKLYINPGIGTNNIKLRLFNHPTIYLYRLKKSK